RRLRDSAEYFGFDCPLDRVQAALERAVAGANRVLRVRLLLAEDGTVRTEQAALETQHDPVRVALDLHPIDRSDVFVFHKTTKRPRYEQAMRPGFDDVILWNEEGEATESTIANLVVEVDGRQITPPVASGLLGGTFRAELLARGEIAEEVVSVARLREAPRI